MDIGRTALSQVGFVAAFGLQGDSRELREIAEFFATPGLNTTVNMKPMDRPVGHDWVRKFTRSSANTSGVNVSQNVEMSESNNIARKWDVTQQTQESMQQSTRRGWGNGTSSQQTRQSGETMSDRDAIDSDVSGRLRTLATAGTQRTSGTSEGRNESLSVTAGVTTGMMEGLSRTFGLSIGQTVGRAIGRTTGVSASETNSVVEHLFPLQRHRTEWYPSGAEVPLDLQCVAWAKTLATLDVGEFAFFCRGRLPIILRAPFVDQPFESREQWGRFVVEKALNAIWTRPQFFAPRPPERWEQRRSLRQRLVEALRHKKPTDCLTIEQPVVTGTTKLERLKTVFCNPRTKEGAMEKVGYTNAPQFRRDFAKLQNNDDLVDCGKLDGKTYYCTHAVKDLRHETGLLALQEAWGRTFDVGPNPYEADGKVWGTWIEYDTGKESMAQVVRHMRKFTECQQMVLFITVADARVRQVLDRCKFIGHVLAACTVQEALSMGNAHCVDGEIALRDALLGALLMERALYS